MFGLTSRDQRLLIVCGFLLSLTIAVDSLSFREGDRAPTFSASDASILASAAASYNPSSSSSSSSSSTDVEDADSDVLLSVGKGSSMSGMMSGMMNMVQQRQMMQMQMRMQQQMQMQVMRMRMMAIMSSNREMKAEIGHIRRHMPGNCDCCQSCPPPLHLLPKAAGNNHLPA